MRFAYADPPYPGQSRKWYGKHADYAGEVDHADLIVRLCRDYPDGWALSTSMVALRDVLPMCPPESKIAAWHVTNGMPAGAAKWKWHYCWEPVIVCGGRPSPGVRNVLSAASPMGFLAEKESFPGAKPPVFTRWIVSLLGATPDDTIDDLFAGSGAVACELGRFRSALF